MSNSSYSFPIFISSPEYNLIDLRAELAYFLEDLGYLPQVSSQEGFPEHTPEYTPWESCLKVLESSFIMILIIDGRYGTPLKWVKYPEIIQDEISATHGEYRLAHHKNKKILVYVRKGIQEYYQIYRRILGTSKDRAACQAELKGLLPNNIDFRALEFFGEVKTKMAIPWIVEFTDVVSIKKQIQKQLLNQLAEAYHNKDKNLDTVIDAFEGVMNELSKNKQNEILEKIGITKKLLAELAENKKEAQQLRENLIALEIIRKNEVNVLKKSELEYTRRTLFDKLSGVNERLDSEKNQFVNLLKRANSDVINSGNPSPTRLGLSIDPDNSDYVNLSDSINWKFAIDASKNPSFLNLINIESRLADKKENDSQFSWMTEVNKNQNLFPREIQFDDYIFPPPIKFNFEGRWKEIDWKSISRSANKSTSDNFRDLFQLPNNDSKLKIDTEELTKGIGWVKKDQSKK